MTRRGDDLTKPFMPSMYSDEWQIRLGEELAQKFTELLDHTDLDEPMRALFIGADDAIGALLTEIWKRSAQGDLEKPPQRVVIVVDGGIAECYEKPAGVQVVIADHDEHVEDPEERVRVKSEPAATACELSHFEIAPEIVEAITRHEEA